ncbi:inner nuclear membrane protein enriched at telomere/subtelomere region [Puccinia graminis f. sp. tritici]|uniref:Inner nuclear membrane protein enriched at telomere/subtelomere region n=1 Tax=Puccinia graminis f. sp. tritici TaxID=56615 RepID=A0A5B0N9H6_PUCGR|nr:inner nuclear membrane protein enriched at telomere/subtelomere region [Puccinia graminis f. sp. tritici]
MAQSTNPEPPPDWMLPGFDPNSVKISELRSILLENNIPHSYTKKADLVQLFNRQVKPMTAKLLKDHQNVKPSAAGIFDMRTGRYLTDDDPPATRSPRKKASSTISIDQESLTSNTSKQRTSRRATNREPSITEPEGESTPQVRSVRGRATNQRNQRESTQPDSSPEKPPRRTGKRKASEQPTPSEPEPESEVDQQARPSEENLSQPSSSMTNSSLSPAPVKKRRSELPAQSSASNSNDQEPAIAKKNISKSKNRRSTLHEALESGEGTFIDFNPFQSGAEDDKSGSSSKKPRPSKRQSSVKRSSIAPAQLPKSSTTPNIFNTISPTKSNPASHQIPVPPNHTSPTLHATPSFLPKSTTTADVYSLQQTPARESIRKSGAFPSLASNRRLTMTHLQDDFDGNSSFDLGNPEHIQQLLAPEENETVDGPTLPRSRHSTTYHEAERMRSSRDSIGGTVPHETVLQPTRTPASVQSRRQSQLPPRTPYAQTLSHSSSNLQYQTPIPRPHIQRVRLDELVQTPAEKRLKITKPFRRTIPKRNGMFTGPSQVISFFLRLGCLGLMFGAVSWYRGQVERLGYCDTGMKSNAITRDQRIDQFLDLGDMDSSNDLETFSGTFRAKMGQAFDAATAVGLLPDCQSCPPHAICEGGRIIRCEPDFVKTHTDWEKAVHSWMPMFMGPKCLPDTAKLVKIVETANQLNQILKKQRGRVLCGMGMRASDEEEERLVKIKVYGLEEKEVQDQILSHSDKSASPSLTSSSDQEIFELAIKDLEKSGQILRDQGWLATADFKQLEMGLKCRLKLGLFKTIKKFKLILLSLVLVLAGWIYIRLTISSIAEEKQKVRELVELALTKLRDESWIHHTNPALSPQPPTLASAQLRDLILSYDHSPVNRQKLWKKVEKIVEGNSNVRTKVSEIRGESIKVWEWIGSYKANLNLNNHLNGGATVHASGGGNSSHQYNGSPDANSTVS